MVALPLDSGNNSERPNWLSYVRNDAKKIFAGALVLLVLILGLGTNFFQYARIQFRGGNSDVCPLMDFKFPEGKHDNATVSGILGDPLYRKHSARRLSEAIQIDTQVYDTSRNVTDDPTFWAKFKLFHKYLEKTFPAVYSRAEVTKVNKYGLVFYLKGSDKNLKPIVLAAHQDTVPVQEGTLGKWTHPPFSGYYDGKFMYGRGASDCKNVLVGIMEVLDILIQNDFEPKRGIIAAFGFDEEISGWYGAASLSQYLQEKFGENSIYAIFDEGPGLAIDPISQKIVAVAATGEKGWADVAISLFTPGGHSSIPPEHTSIGFMSELATVLERNPYDSLLTTKNPTFDYLQCSAVHSGHSMPRFFRNAILRSGYDKFANSIVVKELNKFPLSKYLIQTAQSLTIVRGGEKSNSLPEYATLNVNNRIAVESSYEELVQSIIEKVLQLARTYDLGVEAFNRTIAETTKNGHFEISFNAKPLNPAPVSPTDDIVWEYLSGSIRTVFEKYVFQNLSYPIVTAPSLMPANTDTRHYWKLTRNIFRFTPSFSNTNFGQNNIHSVDEKLEFDSHLQFVAFLHEYLLTIDTQKAENNK